MTNAAAARLQHAVSVTGNLNHIQVVAVPTVAGRELRVHGRLCSSSDMNRDVITCRQCERSRVPPRTRAQHGGASSRMQRSDEPSKRTPNLQLSLNPLAHRRCSASSEGQSFASTRSEGPSKVPSEQPLSAPTPMSQSSRHKTIPFRCSASLRPYSGLSTTKQRIQYSREPHSRKHPNVNHL